jgi:hypothetical protein
MEIRIEQKWALEELADALRHLKSVGIAVVLSEGEMYLSGIADSSVILKGLSGDAVEEAVKRIEDEQPIPDNCDDC